MKIRWIGLTIFVFALVGISAFSHVLLRNDKKKKIQTTLNKGNYLASLIALNPVNEFDDNKRTFFLRTLTEYISSEGLAYCMIHDHRGEVVLSLAPYDLAKKIPKEIQTKALYTMGLTNQAFTLSKDARTLYEFAKPIFEKGKRVGTVRVGLELPRSSLLSMERISMLAMITFFILATGGLLYYGISSALIPLKNHYFNLVKSDGNSSDTSSHSLSSGGMFHIIKDLELSFEKLRDTLTHTKTNNVEMSTLLGVANYQRKQISRVIDSIDFGIIITDLHDNIIETNDYMLDLLGLKTEEVLNRVLSNVLTNEEILEFIAQQESLKQNIGLKQIETQFPEIAPGKTFRVKLSYLKDGEGSLTSKMLSIKDITDEKSVEKSSQDFIAQVAHEFLTPLTTIRSYNEMLMDGEVDDDEMQKEFYNTIGEETSRLSRLIQNLLNIAKIEMGAMTLQTGLVKTDWLMNDCLSSIEGSALKKGITIQKNLPDQFPNLVGDKELLKTALINLLGNAAKYSPENAEITFSLINETDKVIFEVGDTGYGIDEEDLPHIFDKFYRSNNPQITEETGSGLGLAMTAEIIQLHGGEIEVQSEIGKGTQFTISIQKEEFYLGKQ
ncbi:sensor histidine kinase [Thermodesulfobacteriota bacterium]